MLLVTVLVWPAIGKPTPAVAQHADLEVEVGERTTRDGRIDVHATASSSSVEPRKDPGQTAQQTAQQAVGAPVREPSCPSPLPALWPRAEECIQASVNALFDLGRSALDDVGQDPEPIRVRVQRAVAELTGGGGTIRFSPADRALANLPTYFWVDGFQLPDEQAVARLTTGDQLVLTLRLEGVRWAFHDTTRRAGRRPRRTPERYLDGVQGLGRPWWPTHEGPNGELSPVSWTFRRGGRYVVTVTYEWTATATVNGQPLPPMRLTSSPPSRELLVDELRAVITR